MYAYLALLRAYSFTVVYIFLALNTISLYLSGKGNLITITLHSLSTIVTTITEL